MSAALFLVSLRWDDETIDKLWKKYRVEWWEVEEVMFDDTSAVVRRVVDRTHGIRWLARGRTGSGRMLRIYLRPVNERERIWVCTTAWEERG